MSQFFINRPAGLDSIVKTVVKQSFPFVSPSEFSFTQENEISANATEITTRLPGSKRERFVWGVSLMGSSRLIG